MMQIGQNENLFSTQGQALTHFIIFNVATQCDQMLE